MASLPVIYSLRGALRRKTIQPSFFDLFASLTCIHEYIQTTSRPRDFLTFPSTFAVLGGTKERAFVARSRIRTTVLSRIVARKRFNRRNTIGSQLSDGY
jgi:hypothetical protein